MVDQSKQEKRRTGTDKSWKGRAESFRCFFFLAAFSLSHSVYVHLAARFHPRLFHKQPVCLHVLFFFGIQSFWNQQFIHLLLKKSLISQFIIPPKGLEITDCPPTFKTVDTVCYKNCPEYSMLHTLAHEEDSTQNALLPQFLQPNLVQFYWFFKRDRWDLSPGILTVLWVMTTRTPLPAMLLGWKREGLRRKKRYCSRPAHQAWVAARRLQIQPVAGQYLLREASWDPQDYPVITGGQIQTTWMHYQAAMTPERGRAKEGWRERMAPGDDSPCEVTRAPQVITAKILAWCWRPPRATRGERVGCRTKECYLFCLY